MLSFVEGCGRTSFKERQRFFVVAKASILEAPATLDAFHAYHVITDEECSRLKDICDHVAAMLTLWR